MCKINVQSVHIKDFLISGRGFGFFLVEIKFSEYNAILIESWENIYIFEKDVIFTNGTILPF